MNKPWSNEHIQMQWIRFSCRRHTKLRTVSYDWLFNEATLKSTWGMWPQWHAHWRRQWPLLFCLAYHWKCSTLINISLLTEMFRLDLKNVFFKISLIFLLFSFLISLSLSLPVWGYVCMYVIWLHKCSQMTNELCHTKKPHLVL